MDTQLERIATALEGIEYNLDLIKRNLESSTSGLNVAEAIGFLEEEVKKLNK